MATVFAGEPGPPFPFWKNIEARPSEGLAYKTRAYGGPPEARSQKRWLTTAATSPPI